MLNPKSRLALFVPLLLVVLVAAAWPRSNFFEWEGVAAPASLECYGARDVAVVCFLTGTGTVYSVEETR